MRRIDGRLTAAAGGLAALFVAGCGYMPDIPFMGEEENEGVLDYIAANDLQEVDQIRFFQQYSYTYVNDNYVTIPTYAGDYLVEFSSSCPELRQTRMTPEMMDRRDDNRTLRARYDTIRGCRIGKIYEISEAQAAEITALGDAPGEDTYIPEEETK